MEVDRSTVISNMLWRFAEKCGTQVVSFIVTLVLARLLLPEDYGVVSIIAIFTTIMNLFMDAGFRNALVQKLDADQIDYSTVFYFNVFMGIFLYFLMYIFAPVISSFYEKVYMTPYIRVMSLTLILGGINGVQAAIIAKKMEFKRFFFSSLSGTLLSALVGIAMAYFGFGVWALIAQRLVNEAVDTGFLWITVKWRPSLVFSLKRLKPMFNYGSKLLGSSLLNALVTNLSGLVIGKVYPADTIAYYDKGRQIPNLVVENIQTSVQSVLFPVLASKQNDKKQIKRILRTSFMLAAYCIFPCMVGIGVCAESLVTILYTEKWITMVPYLRLWCFIFAFFLLHTAHLQVIQALGRSDIFLKIEVIKQVLTALAIFAAIPFGSLAMLAASCFVAAVSLYINAFPNQKLADYGFLEQIKDILPIIMLNMVMGIIVFLLGKLSLPTVFLLCIQIVAGVGIYVAGSSLLELESYKFIKNTLLIYVGKFFQLKRGR